MKILVVATRDPNRPPEDFAPLLGDEAKMALKMVADDFVREIHGRTDGKGAVMVCEAIDEAEVRAKLGELPLAKAGLLSFEVYPLVPYRGIAIAADKL